VKKLKEFLINSRWGKELFRQNQPQTTRLVLIAIVLIYLFLFLAPKTKALFFELGRSAGLKAKIVDIKKSWANLSLLEKRISQLDEKTDWYEKKLPSGKEIPAVLEYLSDSAKKIGVRITEIKPVEYDRDKLKTAALYHKAPIILKAECGYHELGRFLNELENADRFMRINDLKIVANPQKTDVHYIQLTVVTYVMKK